jgi:hypothetical protein
MAKDSANQGLFADFKKAGDELERLRKLAKTIAPDLLQSGHDGGKGFLSGFVDGLSGIGQMMMPLLIGGAILASPAIAALIGSAVAVGLGLGFAGLGGILAYLLLPKVKKAFTKTGQLLMKTLTYAVSGAFDDGLLRANKVFQLFIPQFRKQLRGIFDQLGPMLPGLTEGIAGGIGELLTGIGTAIKQITSNGSLQTFIDTIPMVAQAVGDFLVDITKDGPALSRFIYDAANAIVGFLEGAGKVIAWLTGVYNWVVKLNDKGPEFIGWTRKLDWLKQNLPIIGHWFADLWRKIVDGVKSVGHWFADIGRNVWAWLKGAGSAIADWWHSVVAFFSALPGQIAAYLSALPGRIRAAFTRGVHEAVYLVGYMAGRVVRFFMDLPGRIATWVTRAWTFVTTAFRNGRDATVRFAQELPGRVASFFSQLWHDVTTWAARTWTSVVAWFRRTRDDVIHWAADAVNSVITWFRGLPGRAAEQGKAFKDRVLSFFADAGKWLYNAGKDIVRGLVSGLKDMWDWAIDKIKSLAHDLKQGFDDAIGRHSPAKAFVESGVDSARGYIVGVMKGLPQVRQAWRQMMSGIPAPAYAGGVSPAMAQTIGRAPTGGYGGGDVIVDNHIQVDGQTILRVLTKPAQRRKARSGVSGLG